MSKDLKEVRALARGGDSRLREWQVQRVWDRRGPRAAAAEDAKESVVGTEHREERRQRLGPERGGLYRSL